MESHKLLLPRGIQDFEELRTGGYYYVDKTDLVWQIANTYKFCFLSRPRRFGKSLLTSTLKYYFEGRSDLFRGLKIMDLEQAWPKRQVFHFDFSGIDSAKDLTAHLSDRIQEYEAVLGIEHPKSVLKDRMFDLMRHACQQTDNQVAVLVDEYDAPLQNTLFRNEEQDALKDVYRSFFPCFKTGSQFLKCLFLTGIMKFTQLSLFSVLNTLVNLSFNPRFATVCGITKEEMRQVFDAELKSIAEEKDITKLQVLAQMEAMYDGYHFHWKSDGIFNPYSVVNALSEHQFSNFWISSGGNQMLSEMLGRYGSQDKDFDGCMVDNITLEESDANATDVTLFLYQAGYLTIKEFDGDVYTLGSPNREVRQALYSIVLPNALAKREDQVSNCTTRIKAALNKADIDEVMENLQSIVAGTPYSQDNSQKAMEDRFVFILKHVFYLCNCDMEEERHVAKGRIDLVAHHRKCILVMELKMDSNGGVDAAENQMTNRKYADAYKAEQKLLFTISMDFSTEQRGLTNYKINKINS